MMMQRLGLVGPGIMGAPMARNLMRAGYELHVFARRPAQAAPLVAAGAIDHRTPAEVAAQCDATLVVVSDTADVQEVVTGKGGIQSGAAPGHVVVDMSTISPVATRRMAASLAEMGIHMLDAPVSGGEQGAIDGTLSIMVGGRQDIFDRLLPVFRMVGGNIVHVGDSGAGQVAKACNQLLVAQTIAAVGEAFALAGACGVDARKVREALLGGFARSRILEVHGDRILEGRFDPGFKARLHHKDMAIVLQTAHDLGLALPGAALAAQGLNALMGEGKGEWDSSVLGTLALCSRNPSADT